MRIGVIIGDYRARPKRTNFPTDLLVHDLSSGPGLNCGYPFLQACTMLLDKVADRRDCAATRKVMEDDGDIDF